jgi:hypothetical protein
LVSGTRQRAPVVALLLLGLAALACALPGSSTPAPSPLAPSPLPARSPTPDSRPIAGTPLATLPAVENVPFAPLRLTPFPAPGALARYPLRLDLVQNQAALAALPEAERKTLAERGFVAASTPYATLTDLYRDVTAEGIPLLFTADAALYTLDVIAGVAWQRAEGQLAPHLQALGEGLVAASQLQWEEAEDAALATAAWHNMVYFSVGSRLLNPAFPVPAAVAEIVDEELTLVRQGGSFISPLRGVQLDYGRLQPAGRYAGSTELSRYFQARNWYAEPFYLDAAEPGLARQHARQLGLMALALDESDNMARWERISSALAYFESSTTTGGMAEVGAALAASGGLGALADERVDNLVVTLANWPPDAIAAISGTTSSYSFLPPTTPLAGAILPAFVYNRVGSYAGELPAPVTAVETNIGPVRALPRSLDAAAALGSGAALKWLAEAGDTQYQGYEGQLAHMRVALQQIEPDRYAAAWLLATQSLLLPPEGRPPYAASDAWVEHQLNAWLGGWILQHHSTTLAPRPVDYIPLPAADAPGFVVASPELLAALAALARQVEEGLRQRELLDPEVGQKLLQLERLYLALQEAAAAAQTGARMGDDRLLLLAQLGPRLEALLTFAPQEAGVPLVDAGLARTVTTYTDPASGASMAAALGPAWSVYAIVEREGELWLAAGGILTASEQRLAAVAEATVEPADALEDPPPWLASLLAESSSP